MKHEAWEKICHLLNQEELLWVFRDVLDKSELSNLLKESRLSWLTTRLEGSSDEELAERAARAFRTNPHVARTAVEVLDTKCLVLLEKVTHQSGREVREGMVVSEEMLTESRVGEFLWVLARDERQEVNEALDALRAGLLHLLRRSGGRRTEAKAQDDDTMKRITGDLTAAREEAESLKSKLTHLELIEDETKDLRRENEGLKRRREDQEKELARLQAEVLEAASDSNVLARMEREVRRLAFTLEKVEAQIGGTREQSTAERGLFERLDAWYEDLAAWGQAREKAEGEILGALKDLHERDMAPPPAPVAVARETPPPLRPEPGREKVAVFVDGQSMYFGARRAGGKLDFKRFIEGTVRGRTLVKAVAYLVQGEKDVGGLAGLLKRYGYEVRIKERAPSAALKRVGWEMEIAMDVLASLGDVDVVALGSGEEEFISLAEFLRNRSIRFEVYAFPETVSPALKEVADSFHPLGDEMVLHFDRWSWEGPQASRPESRPSGTGEEPNGLAPSAPAEIGPA